MKLGYINYLNCYPFYHRMFCVEPLADVEIIEGYPSDLNRMMQNGALDMSPISAAAYLALQDEVDLLPEFCLSSVGYVRSVVLVSRLPIEELDGKTVGLSSASQTSVVLLKILLKKHFGVEPFYVQTDPFPTLDATGCSAALIIGNEAMTELSEPYVYDLGDLWMRSTGFPVVFAVFAIRRSARRKYRESVRAVITSYQRSIDCLTTDRLELIHKAKDRYPSVEYDIDGYLRLLHYRFTPVLKRALSYYFELAGEMQLLPQVKTLRFYQSSNTVDQERIPKRQEVL